MPTCTQITDALNVLASATTNPNVLNDLSGLTAVLTGIGTTETLVSLIAGGTAVLAPIVASAIDGKAVEVICAGRMHGASSPINDIGTATVYFSNAGIQTAIGSGGVNFGGGGGVDASFLYTAQFVYDPTIQEVTGFYSISFGGNLTSASFSIPGVPSDSDVGFVVSGLFGQSVPANSLTLTQYKMQLI